MKIKGLFSVTAALLLVTAFAVFGETPATEIKPPAKRHLTAKNVFDYRTEVLFSDDFTSGNLDRWNLSEDDRYELASATPGSIDITDAPGPRGGGKAVQFTVERRPNSFRSEISLPSESGFHERWYAERMFIPADWVANSESGNDIVMQWHAIPGNGRPTFPNLDISIGGQSWFIKQSFGSPQAGPTRTTKKLDDPVKPGEWVAWVIHARWSPDDNGLLQIWKDGKLVLEKKGANVYTTIGVEYTPYLKTGIYHPEWHLDTDRKREAFAKAQPAATTRTIYISTVRVADQRANLESFLSPPK